MHASFIAGFQAPCYEDDHSAFALCNPAVLAFVSTSSQHLPKMPKEKEELDQ